MSFKAPKTPARPRSVGEMLSIAAYYSRQGDTEKAGNWRKLALQRRAEEKSSTFSTSADPRV